MKLNYISFLFFSLFIFINNLSAQQVKGFVFDEKSKETLVGANIISINDGLFVDSDLQKNIDNAYKHNVINPDAHKRLSDYIDYCDQLIQTDLFDHTLQHHVDMR